MEKELDLLTGEQEGATALFSGQHSFGEPFRDATNDDFAGYQRGGGVPTIVTKDRDYFKISSLQN